MTLLTAAEASDLAATLVGATAGASLVLDRDGVDLAAQAVVYRYVSRRQDRPHREAGAAVTEADVLFYRLSPFDAEIGDRFALNGETGTIRRVYADPVLTGVIVAEATLDVGSL